MKGKERQLLKIPVEDIEELDISVENNSYHTLYKRCNEEDDNYTDENYTCFHQIIYDLEEDVCMYCGQSADNRDHSNCKDIIITEEELINMITEIADAQQTEQEKIIFSINGEKYKIV